MLDFDFKPFPKMARLSREILITEKLDGTNAHVNIVPLSEHFLEWVATSNAEYITVGDMAIMAASRNRYLSPSADNFGFAKWCRYFMLECLRAMPSKRYYNGCEKTEAMLLPDPEGVIVYHVAAGVGFKKTILHDESPKSAHQ